MGRTERIQVEFGRDFLVASVSFLPDSSGARPTDADLSAALAAAGVRHGIDPESLKLALASPPGKKTIVARGEPPRSGVDGVIRYVEKPGQAGAPRALENGRVDHRDLQLVKNVVKGQVLAEKEPPLPGRPGIDVRGIAMAPPSVADPAFPKGANTAVTPDGQRLVSLIDGHLAWKQPGQGRVELAVDDTFILNRAVDMSTGNLDCIGACVIRGRVNDGFSIAAGRDITVHGAAEGSNFTSREGSILFEQGFKGHGKSAINAKKNVHARFIENAVVEAEGDIIVKEHVYQSTLKAGGSIRVEGDPGVIMGGSVAFLDRLVCRQLGSPTNPKTRVYLGDWISGAARSRIAEIQNVLAELNVGMEAMRQALLEMRRLTMDNPDENQEKIATLAASAEGFPNLRERSARLEAEMKTLEARIVTRDSKPTLEVSGTLFVGVILNGDGVLEEVAMRADKHNTRISLATGEDGQPRFAAKSMKGAPARG